jgi:ornithine--oxo-acid transaminase
VHNAGHNHPRIVDAIKDELDQNGPAMLQSHVSDLAGELATRLCARASGRLNKVFFCSSGSEAIEASIKFARAHTHRVGVLCAEGGFHGLTCGALSLMSNLFWRQDFGPLLPQTETVPFGDTAKLEEKIASKRFAAFIVEPIQGEGGIRIPHPEYLQRAQAICRRHSTLFVLDEVQTGMDRTGLFLAAAHFKLDPDMVLLAKALSGGLIPSGALLMSDSIYDSVYRSIKEAFVHTSTYSENSLAMRAGLAVLDVLEDEKLAERAKRLGDDLRTRLRDTLGGYEMVQEVRGIGLFCGIEFRPPKSLTLRVPFEAFRKVHPGLFGQALVSKLFNEAGILTQICGNHFMVLKVAPPLVVSEQQVEEFIVGVRRTVEEFHSSKRFWSENLELAGRAIRV